MPAQVNSGCAVDRHSQHAAWCPRRLVSALMFTPHEHSCLRVKWLDNHTQGHRRLQVHMCRQHGNNHNNRDCIFTDWHQWNVRIIKLHFFEKKQFWSNLIEFTKIKFSSRNVMSKMQKASGKMWRQECKWTFCGQARIKNNCGRYSWCKPVFASGVQLDTIEYIVNCFLEEFIELNVLM